MKTQNLVAMSSVIGLLLALVAFFGVHAAETRPPVYVVIEVDEIADTEEFKETLFKLTPSVVVEAKVDDARFLALSQRITALDGPAPKFLAIVAFQNVEKAQTFHENMKEILVTRPKPTKSRSFIVDNANSGVRPF
jgi:fumarylacetoacetate (FAA) hydrolase family protein